MIHLHIPDWLSATGDPYSSGRPPFPLRSLPLTPTVVKCVFDIHVETIFVFTDDGRVFADDGRVLSDDGRVLSDDGRIFIDDGRVSSGSWRRQML